MNWNYYKFWNHSEEQMNSLNESVVTIIFNTEIEVIKNMQ